MEQKNEQSALILVVDDEPDIRRIIRILLESGGYRVAEAQNGLAAVEYVRKQPGVDLVLCSDRRLVAIGRQSRVWLCS